VSIYWDEILLVEAEECYAISNFIPNSHKLK